MPLPLLPIALGLAQFAPALMRYFGAGETSTAVAEKVVGIAQTISGAPTPEAALEAIRSNAALQAKFQELALELDAELERAYLADRADARKRDVALVQAGVRNTRANWMILLDVVGLLSSLGAMCGLGYVKARYPDAMTEGVFGALLAQFSALASFFGLGLRDAHQFEFGSSRGSKESGEIVAQAALRSVRGPQA